MGNKRVELEELLPVGQFDSYFVIYPKTQNSGYTLNIETRSFGRIASENIINKIEFVPFDIDMVQNLYTESIQQGVTPHARILDLPYDLEVKNIQKYGTAIYKVETMGSGILELGQGYEEGWISFPKLEHIKVNSWANGYKINNDGVYYIFFWPQLLEWGGFVLLLLTIIYLIVKSKKIS